MIHLLGRGIIIQQQHILLSHKQGRDYAYLPGGHIELWESAAGAIIREIDEEFGGKAVMDDYVTTIENSYRSRDRERHDLSIVFAGRLLDVTYPDPPKPLEPNLRFTWHAIDRLEEAHVMPPPMTDVIRRFVTGEPVPPFISHIQT
jgi:ADP-ribose pyrophosphatase YjhB (NUDIX family)